MTFNKKKKKDRQIVDNKSYMLLLGFKWESTLKKKRYSSTYNIYLAFTENDERLHNNNKNLIFNQKNSSFYYYIVLFYLFNILNYQIIKFLFFFKCLSFSRILHRIFSSITILFNLQLNFFPRTHKLDSLDILSPIFFPKCPP